MPEQIPSPDLDRAFDDLVRDVDTLTRRRGADAAMRTARRRRTTTVAAGAAAAVLVAGGLGWALLPGDGEDGDDTPVATEPDLPAAAPFRARDLMAAYDSTWSRGAPALPTVADAICSRPGDAEPVTTADRQFRATPPENRAPATWGAGYVYARFATPATTIATTERITEGWSQCDLAPTDEANLDLGPDATGYVAAYPASDGDARRDQYVVQSGDRLVLLTVVGAPRTPSGSIDVDRATALATDLLAGLLAEE